MLRTRLCAFFFRSLSLSVLLFFWFLSSSVD
jgi:hypothetical protein